MSFSLHKVLGKHRGRVFKKWVFNAHSDLLTNASVADIDQDGELEIVFGTKKGTIHCLNEEAQEVWQYNTGKEISGQDAYFYDMESIHSINSEPILADINNDGKKEIIVGTLDGRVYVLNHIGELLWSRTIGGQIKGSPLVQDINNDGSIEIVVASTNKKLVILNAKGEAKQEITLPAESESTPGLWRGKKGKPSMLLVGLNDKTLRAYDLKGEEIWSITTGEKITAQPIILSAKGSENIVFGSWDGTLYSVSLNGEIQWKFKTQGAIYNKAITGDINNDGKPEIIFGSCDNTIYALTHNGEKIWSYETDFWVVAPPILTDIDQDGKTEVVAGSFDNNIYILEGAGNYSFNYVPGLSAMLHQAGHYADILSSEPGEQRGKKIWQYQTEGIIVGCSLLTSKGTPHIIVNVKSGVVDDFTISTK